MAGADVYSVILAVAAVDESGLFTEISRQSWTLCFRSQIVGSHNIAQDISSDQYLTCSCSLIRVSVRVG